MTKETTAFIFRWNDLIKTYVTQNNSRNVRFKNKKHSKPTLSSQAKRLAFALGTYSDNETGTCWPNLENHLMAECGITIADYKNGINELVAKGLVEVEKIKTQTKTTKGLLPVNSNCYHLKVSVLENTDSIEDVEVTAENNSYYLGNSQGVTAENNSKVSVENNSVTTHNYSPTLIDSNSNSKRDEEMIEDEVVDEEDKWEEFFGEIDDDESEVRESWTLPDIKEDELLDRMMGRKKEAARAEEEEVNPYIYVYDPGMSDEDNYIMKSIVDENRMKWDEERSRI